MQTSPFDVLIGGLDVNRRYFDAAAIGVWGSNYTLSRLACRRGIDKRRPWSQFSPPVVNIAAVDLLTAAMGKVQGWPSEKDDSLLLVDQCVAVTTQPGFQDHLDALIGFVLECLVTLRRVLQTHPVGYDERWIDMCLFNQVQ